MRLFVFGVLAVLCAMSSVDSLAQYTFSTTPSPPQAGQPFDVSMTGTFPGFFFIAPQVSVVGGTITVDLDGACGFPLCPGGSGTATKTFTMPALPTGSYVMTVYLTRCCRPEFGQFSFVVGTPLAIPALSTSGIVVLVLMLLATVWVTQRRERNDA
jgi:hypothetical protein